MKTARKKAKTKGKREKKRRKREVTVQGRQPMLGHISWKKSQQIYDCIELINVAFSIKL